MFDREGDEARIKSWIKDGVVWQVGDAGDPELVKLLGSQDIVVANNFLCHMAPADAEKCLRNIAQLVGPSGYVFVSGIDLDVRTKVALDSGWTPVRELLEEIHDGDPCMRHDWPWNYWGLEPLNKKRTDWKIRYATAFQIGNHT
jgi:SAM-dependent methyltransferase